MKCQNCETEVPEEAERCERCGAKLLHRRVVLGSPRIEEFALSSETESEVIEDAVVSEDWQFPARTDALVAPALDLTAPAPDTKQVTLYGGFFRRLMACVFDLLTIFLLCTLMGMMAYIGYKVGLAAHGRSVSMDNASPLIFFLGAGCLILTTVYFVLFHGLGGQTPGKWILGLRVVGPAQEPISGRRALLRWIGLIGFAGISVGLSCVWILWSGEKRAWHDYLAGTWVIRVRP